MDQSISPWYLEISIPWLLKLGGSSRIPISSEEVELGVLLYTAYPITKARTAISPNVKV